MQIRGTILEKIPGLRRFAAPREDGGRVLQLHEVLEEEYLELHPEESLDPFPNHFEPGHILELEDLAERWGAEPGEGARTCDSWVAQRLDRGTRRDLRRYRACCCRLRRIRKWMESLDAREAGGAVARRRARGAALRELLEERVEGLAAQLPGRLAGELNELLRARLDRAAPFADAASRPYTRTRLEHPPRAQAAAEPEYLRRCLLEDAYPTQLARISDLRLARVYAGIRRHEHAALCLSGGGVRSATFALGVVQALARHGLMDRFHYLSTVSGGGYLGGWLSAWMTHASAEAVLDQLHCAPRSKLEPEPAPIRHLRWHSNFLTPRVGLFSADTWTVAATYLRNLLLTWLVLVPLLAAAMMVPRLALAVVRAGREMQGREAQVMIGMLILVGVALGISAVAYVHGRRPDLAPEGARQQARRIGDEQVTFLWRCLLPLVLAAITLTTAWSWSTGGARLEGAEGFWLALSFIGAGLLLHAAGWAIAAWDHLRLRDFWAVAGTGALAGLFAFGATHLIALVGAGMVRGELTRLAGLEAYDAGRVTAELGAAAVALETMRVETAWYVTAALPIFLAVLMLGEQLYLGVVSRRRAEDEEREWAARFDAWLLIVLVGWLAIAALVLFGPALAGRVGEAVAGAGIASGLATILLGRSPRTPGGAKAAEGVEGKKTTRDFAGQLRGFGLAVAAPVFVAVLVVLLATLNEWLIGRAVALLAVAAPIASALTVRTFGPEYAWAVWVDAGPESSPLVVGLVAAGLLGFGLAMGGLIDTNKFSLHAMYRMRLIRAYLGASRPAGDRRPDPFTGFDRDDNLYMRRLWPARPVSSPVHPPLHVVNLALNLVGGRNLGWQERKAESFTVTSLHAGSPLLGYRRTSPAPVAPGRPRSGTGPLYGGTDGLTLGTAITISGAAANPNMGYHSSRVVTFLMTLFNARLGWWLGNPGPAGDTTFARSSPRLSVRPILSEMFGLTDDRSPYVHLSDGGHFENLGLYEMVLRRCRFIVVSDAGCDGDCALEDLGNAIRKIRIDLGIPIEFDPDFGIYPRSQPERSEKGRYWAVARIRYSSVDRPAGDRGDSRAYDGTLVYLKPAFYGSEPRDVFNYAQAHPEFPHESTIDQFFSESQFESYRALGSHVIDRIYGEGAVQAGGRGAGAHRRPLQWFQFKIRPRGEEPAARS